MRKMILLMMLSAFSAIADETLDWNQILEIKNGAPDQWNIEHNTLFFQEWNEARKPVLRFKDPKQIQKCSWEPNWKACDPEGVLEMPDEFFQLGQNQNYLMIQTKKGSYKLKLSIWARDFPEASVKGKSKIAKDFIFAISNGSVGFLVVTTENGKIRYLKRTGLPVYDLKVHKVAKKKYYSYQEVRYSNTGINSTGPRVVLDSQMNQLFRTKTWFDNHDFQLINEKHYLGTSYQKKSLPGGNCFIEQSIQEWKYGKKVSEITITDLIRAGILYRFHRLATFEKDPTCLDLFHLNGFQLLSENRLLISLGNDGVLMWDIKKKEPEWVLGGLSDYFSLSSDQQTSLHHSITWDEKSKSILLFDNGLKRNRSRVVQFILLPKEKKLTHFQVLHESDLFVPIMGSVESDEMPAQLSTPLTITYGGQGKGGALILEVASGHENFRIQFKELGWLIYRAYRDDPLP